MIAADSALASQVTSGAMFSGARASHSPSGSGAAIAPPRFSVIRVRAPGAIAFTVTPYRPSSLAAMIESVAMPDFAAP